MALEIEPQGCFALHALNSIFFPKFSFAGQCRIFNYVKNTPFFCLSIYLFWLPCASQFPDQGVDPRPLQWKCRDLPTGPPGKSPRFLKQLLPISPALEQHSSTFCLWGFRGSLLNAAWLELLHLKVFSHRILTALVHYFLTPSFLKRSLVSVGFSFLCNK